MLVHQEQCRLLRHLVSSPSWQSACWDNFRRFRPSALNHGLPSCPFCTPTRCRFSFRPTNWSYASYTKLEMLRSWFSRLYSAFFLKTINNTNRRESPIYHPVLASHHIPEMTNVILSSCQVLCRHTEAQTIWRQVNLSKASPGTQAIICHLFMNQYEPKETCAKSSCALLPQCRLHLCSTMIPRTK